MRDNERGFTLIELVVAILVILVMLIFALFFLRSANFTSDRLDAQRRTGIARIVQGINKYVADHGQLPPDIPTKLVAISSGANQYNLCSYLVPTYLKDLPFDPAYGVKLTKDNTASNDACNTPDLTWSTGYGIQRQSDGRVMVVSTLGTSGKITMYVPGTASPQ